ncbi:MAG TPA: FAD-dependent monooxygenase [Burkholderiaceae bacterium]|nr:FAD-dependent monooxygenase [Burkholderiaceae bacterium]
MTQPLSIAVVGAGLGGLTAAAALLRSGFSVDIYEQASQLGDVGAGLQLGANAVRCLQSLGLAEDLERAAVRPAGKQVRLWSTGEATRLFDLGATSIKEYGFPYLMVHRADLHQVLVAAVRRAAPDAIRLGARCVGVELGAEGAVLLTADGVRRRYDAVVGADGVHSHIRAALGNQDYPAFTGCVAWRGLIPVERAGNYASDCMGTNWIGPGAHVITYPIRGGALVNFVGIVERSDWQVESWNVPGTIEECARDFAGWHPDVLKLIHAIDKPYKWALMSRAPLARWSKGCATLLGDACHPTLPFLAQGAAMAIEDGIVLARAVAANPHHLPNAFAAYEATRQERTRRIVEGSAAAGRRFHNPELGSPEGARAYVAREWSEARVRERYQWLFEYDALTTPLAAAVAVA